MESAHRVLPHGKGTAHGIFRSRRRARRIRAPRMITRQYTGQHDTALVPRLRAIGVDPFVFNELNTFRCSRGRMGNSMG